MKYVDFWDALDAGSAKINQYYKKTAESDAYTFSMCRLFFIFISKRGWSPNTLTLVLDPSQKLDHIRKSWGDTLLKTALKEAEEIVS